MVICKIFATLRAHAQTTWMYTAAAWFAVIFYQLGKLQMNEMIEN